MSHTCHRRTYKNIVIHIAIAPTDVYADEDIPRQNIVNASPGTDIKRKDFNVHRPTEINKILWNTVFTLVKILP